MSVDASPAAGIFWGGSGGVEGQKIWSLPDKRLGLLANGFVIERITPRNRQLLNNLVQLFPSRE